MCSAPTFLGLTFISHFYARPTSMLSADDEANEVEGRCELQGADY